MDIGQISVSVVLVCTIGAALFGLIWRDYKKRLDDVASRIEEAAKREDVTRIHARIDMIEARSHDEIRDLRADMNGLGMRLENSFVQRLTPIHEMLMKLIKGKGES